MAEPPALECAGLRKVFAAATPVIALDSVDLQVLPGEMVCLMGRSGSGKSTLLGLLGLLDRPTSGELNLLGQPTTGLPNKQWAAIRRESLGFVFQSFNLVGELTAAANVALALRYQGRTGRRWREKADEALDQVGMSHRRQARVSTLSGGEQQRVAVARALVKQPSIILADEPTGNLDSHNETLIIDLLRKTADSGISVVVATHSQEIAGPADRTIRLHDGRVVA